MMCFSLFQLEEELEELEKRRKRNNKGIGNFLADALLSVPANNESDNED